MAQNSLAYCVVYCPYLCSVQAIPPPPLSDPSHTSDDCPITYVEPSAGNTSTASEVSARTGTTIKIKQLPAWWTAKKAVKYMNSIGLEDSFDFVYVPLDWKTKKNFRFGFINFYTEKETEYGLSVLLDQGFDPSLSRVQGYTKNVLKLVNIPVNKRDAVTNRTLKENEAALPIIFRRDAKGISRKIAFPPPVMEVGDVKDLVSKSDREKGAVHRTACAGDSKKIFLGGFSYLNNISKCDIGSALSIFGSVLHIKLMKGFAFVAFENEEAAKAAIQYGRNRELMLLESATNTSASTSIKPYYR